MIDLERLPLQQADIRPADDTKRIPPGQKKVPNWPILDLGILPRIETGEWRLAIDGAVATEKALGWDEIRLLPQYETLADWHCVTTWSMLDNRWLGVRLSDLLALAAPLPEVAHLVCEGYDGYTTNIPLAVAMEEGSLLVYGRNGTLLTPGHGGPFRTIITSRYAWKSAKWIKRLTLTAEDHPGFWEVRGYHNNADYVTEERYS